ncbi:ATP-dependent Clp protease proteolytic subunit [Megasphaera paucivorans]|uniref:Membrane-bound serine protease (ClpP class) n=1 Tax=Megasphaera paucivorans TaxID=349095 RepID=A0A1G9T357_9FIRM|nr:NfeD family protein [Megasphaera paucivorans]SDM42184.1 membrane-bound serine protease (ClpP class) [Megasphaera paucivorans]
MGILSRLHVIVLCLLAAVCFIVVQPVSAGSQDIRVIAIEGEINAGQVALVRRGLTDAQEQGDHAVIVQINTLGGRVDSALKIRDMLQNTTIPTIAYVDTRAWSAGALIAISCRHIVMAPGSSIGAAEPIPDTEKNIAALKSEFAATASHMGHNPRLVESMVDKTKGYPDYAEAGQILALSEAQAKQLNLSEATVSSIEGVQHQFSLDNMNVVYVERNWKDTIAGFLQNDYVRTLFVGLILAAVLAEIKMAGMGVGIVTAIVLGVLLMYSGDDTIDNDLKVIGAFIASLVLIAMELATPGVGIFGIVGIVLLFGSLFYMLGAGLSAAYIIAGGIIIAAILFYFVGRRLPKSRLIAKLALTTRSTKDKGYTSQADKSAYLDKRGQTITILRPSGTVRIGTERVDAVSDGGFINRGVEVRVIKVEGTRIVVEPVKHNK